MSFPPPPRNGSSDEDSGSQEEPQNLKSLDRSLPKIIDSTVSAGGATPVPRHWAVVLHQASPTTPMQEAGISGIHGVPSGYTRDRLDLHGECVNSKRTWKPAFPRKMSPASASSLTPDELQDPSIYQVNHPSIGLEPRLESLSNQPTGRRRVSSDPSGGRVELGPGWETIPAGLRLCYYMDPPASTRSSTPPLQGHPLTQLILPAEMGADHLSLNSSSNGKVWGSLYPSGSHDHARPVGWHPYFLSEQGAETSSTSKKEVNPENPTPGPDSEIGEVSQEEEERKRKYWEGYELPLHAVEVAKWQKTLLTQQFSPAAPRQESGISNLHPAPAEYYGSGLDPEGEDPVEARKREQRRKKSEASKRCIDKRKTREANTLKAFQIMAASFFTRMEQSQVECRRLEQEIQDLKEKLGPPLD